jgi:hypothetical protein
MTPSAVVNPSAKPPWRSAKSGPPSALREWKIARRTAFSPLAREA